MSSFYYDHEFDNGDDGRTSDGVCVVEEYNRHRGKDVPCGRPASSVVHPPDQFRHWCSSLEAGYDCNHPSESEDYS